MTVSILPQTSTEFERAVERVGARVDLIPTPLPEATRPRAAPAAFLPFLAHGRGVELWRDDWTEARKREVVDRAYELARAKGTLGGIEGWLAFADATLVSAIVPPADFFLSASYADDETVYRRWLKRLPEIRLYAERQPMSGANALAFALVDDRLPVQAFFEAEDGAPTFFLDGDLPPMERATIVRGGVEEDIALYRRPDTRRGRDGEVLTFAWTVEAGLGFFLDASALDAPAFLGAEPGGQAYVEVALNDADAGREAWNVVSPVDFVQDVTPEVATVEIADRLGFWLDVSATDATDYLDVVDPQPPSYRVLRLSDGRDRSGLPGSFLDADRMGMPAYTAELLIDNSRAASSRLLFLDAGALDASAVDDAADDAPIEDARRAVVAGKALRDRVLLDFAVPTRRSLKRARRFSDLSLG